MSKLTEHEGDLFSSTAPALGHGVNCFASMGAGIAVQFRQRYPEMYEAYRQECFARRLLPGNVYWWTAVNVETQEELRHIANISSQEHPGRNATMPFLIDGVTKALEYCEANNLATLALPRIGCGIGGLQYTEQVLPALEELATNSPVDIEVWSL